MSTMATYHKLYHSKYKSPIDYRYDWYTEEEYNQENLIESAEAENIEFTPQSSQLGVFGDEQGTLIGQVFDYILRDGGRSKNFAWEFHEFLR